MIFEQITITSPEGEPITVIQGTDPQGVVWGIPEDHSNSDYQAYLAEQGETK